MTAQGKQVDFVVIGAGMAGASAAATLAEHGSVVILEMEDQPGYHSTGRSAALYTAIYGNAVVRLLTRASRDFLFATPSGFSGTAITAPRKSLYFGSIDQRDLLARFHGEPDIAACTSMLDAAEASALLPVFRTGFLGGAVLDKTSADIDVDALLQGYLRLARKRGAEIATGARVEKLTREAGRWHVATRTGEFMAPVVINAAGAWADEVALSAGVPAIGLQPKRRTAALIDAPAGFDISHWPVAVSIDESFYFKPDAGHLMISPADETDSPPCDAQPEELDVAIAADLFEKATGTQVRRVSHTWAGLRVFSPDRTPVAGFDPNAEGFFWLVGQGGYGIQTAPALASVTASLCRTGKLPADLVAMGLKQADLSPARFRT